MNIEWDKDEGVCSFEFTRTLFALQMPSIHVIASTAYIYYELSTKLLACEAF